jgi:hypothetical protein
VKQKKHQEESKRKILAFEAAVKEAPKFSYNTNLFKDVKLVMSDEEKKEGEEKLHNLAKFLDENAIDKLIKDLKSMDGVPTDS